MVVATYLYCEQVHQTICTAIASNIRKLQNTYLHIYPGKGIQFQNIFVWKMYVIFDVSQRLHTLKLVFWYI